MKQILLFGAGKSATVLIDYILANAEKEDWMLTVADANLKLVKDKLKDSPFGKAVSFDIKDEEIRKQYVAKADIVLSMLPPVLHAKVASDCLEFSKNLLTASYVDETLRNMKQEVESKNLLFLCEMGLDPGIDHMSAMKMIDNIHYQGGKIVSFKSHCGGLVAPESDNNPWHYKISWNPRNIVTAGKSGAVLKKDNKIISLPYESLFENNETVKIPDLGYLAFYPNRDSLSYIPIYKLEESATFIRTTLRYPIFCKAWNYIIKASLTDEASSDILSGTNYSFGEWLDKMVENKTGAADFGEFLIRYVNKEERVQVFEMFNFLGLLSNEKIPETANSAADVLQFALENQLVLQPDDKDMIIMLHEIEYTINELHHSISSSLIVKGENSLHTAMAKTVGLPLGIATKLILNGTIQSKGLLVPVVNDIYEPVLKELEKYDIKFNEENT